MKDVKSGVCGWFSVTCLEWTQMTSPRLVETHRLGWDDELVGLNKLLLDIWVSPSACIGELV